MSREQNLPSPMNFTGSVKNLAKNLDARDNINEDKARIKLFEKELRPEARIVHFWLGDKIVKENKLLYAKEQITDVTFGRDEEEREGIQNIETTLNRNYINYILR